ncbi:MAG: CoA transferase [Dehalococcoidia bacterium]|nr:CoA transferase [Dehalococcoidia bacterium]
MDNAQSVPLKGIRVADFTRVQAGPQATLWLAVMGAEVIRIESKQRPDNLRVPYTALGTNAADADLNRGAYFTSLNYNKKSCTLNLARREGIEIAKKIVSISDIVVENFSPGVMERFGLDYPSLKTLKPDIVMASISGMGQSGPDKDYIAYAPSIHAYSGLSSLTGYLGESCGIMSLAWSDALSAQFAAFAILSALHHRSRTGEGQHIDVSLAEATISALPEAMMDVVMNRRSQKPRGNRDDIMAPHGCYRCRGEDRWVAIAVSSEEEWTAFCSAIGNPSWSSQERFSDMFSRWQNQDELDRLTEAWTMSYTPYEVMEILQGAGVAAAPCLGTDELPEGPHLKERDLFLDMDHPVLGKGIQCRIPWRPGPLPGGSYQRSPLIGEHNDYVFRELLGMSEDELKSLVEQKVVY